MDPAPDDRTREVVRLTVSPAGGEFGSDEVVREEPLEIRVNGVAVAVVMRTPGDDLDLARGFLVTEGVIDRADQLLGVRHCDVVDSPEAEDNVVLAVLDPGVEIDLGRLRRNFFTGSSCGLCGKATIESVLLKIPPLDDRRRVSASVLRGLPQALRGEQVVFERTGGSHAAALFGADGRLRVVREDVGRHNAVDKVIGWALHEREPLRECILMVSGRVSYEIVLKAAIAGISCVCAVSAASSLAIDLAESVNIVLVAFQREDRMSVYAGATRLRAVDGDAGAGGRSP